MRKSHQQNKGKIKSLLSTLIAGTFLFANSSALAAELSLNEAIEVALANNTSLRITRQGELSAEAELREARGNNSLEVNVSGSLSTRKGEGSQRSSSNSASVSASLPLYTGGANEANIKGREINLEASMLTTERERENLKLSVIKAYYDVLEAEKSIVVQKEKVGNYEAHLDDIEILYEAGVQPRIDVLRASVELASARQDLIKAESTYEISKVKLRKLLNMEQDEDITLTTDASYQVFKLSVEDCLHHAFEKRLDLRVLEEELKVSELAIKSAKAGYKPKVNLNLGTGYSSQFKPSSDNTYDITASVTLNWSIFDSGVTNASIDKASTARDTAFLNIIKAREDIDSDMREAYYNMREAERRFSYTGEALDKAEEDYFIASERYRAGEGIILDILDAQLALSTARLNDINARYDYARHLAEVENIMGSSLTETEQNTSTELSYVTNEERERFNIKETERTLTNGVSE